MSPIVIAYEQGTLVVDPGGHAGDGDDPSSALSDALAAVDDLEYDPRSDRYRAPAYRYASVRAALTRAEITVDDRVLTLEALPALESTYDLRSYQRAALADWLETDRFADLNEAGDVGGPVAEAPAGVLELPTGSGKTVIAMAAIARLRTPTLVVVPTIDLQEQWLEELDAEFGGGASIGRFGGGEQRREAITVSTYDSAYLKADSVGNRFGLVVFDEVHHLGGEGYREIGRLLAAPARLGLTATFERPDDAHEVVEDLIGPVVHRLEPDDLAGEHLAAYDVKRLEVPLTPAEREEYEEHQGTFTDYLARSNLTFRSASDYQKLVMRSGTDPEAREALLAKQRAREIVNGSEAKLETLADLLERHADERIIVFTAFNDLAYDVADRFLIPVITHQTGAAERREILERFREGTYSRVVTTNVLDEGVDVPDASVAVVLSGTGSEREFTQRLGRILRPKADGGRAILYEIVSEETAEERVADRRRA